METHHFQQVTPGLSVPLTKLDAQMSIVAPKWRVLSRYQRDIYGRPRILSKSETRLDALVRSVIVGVAIGFGLAIALLVIHDPTVLKHWRKIDPAQVRSLEDYP